MAKNKKNLRILPFFIFLAVLTLSIKINNVFDLLKHPQSNKISIIHPSAFAKETQAPKTDELEKVLNSSAVIVRKKSSFFATWDEAD